MKPDLPAPADPPDPPQRPGLLKRLIKVLTIFIAIFCVLIVILTQVVDMNTFREPITKAISEASGLDVNIGGLNFDWSSGPGLRADEVSVFSQKGKRTLFSSEALVLKVKWRPLLDKRVEVEEAIIRKPVFLVQPHGDFSPAGNPPPQEPNPDPLTPQQMALGPMKRLFMGLHLNAETVKVEDAEILWFPSDHHEEEPLHVKASLVLKVNRPNEERLDLDVRDLNLSAGGLQMEGSVEARDVLSPRGSLKTDFSGQPFELQTLVNFLDYLPAEAKKIWYQFDPTGEVTAWSLDSSMERVNLFDESSFKGSGLNAGLNFSVKNLVLQPPADRPELRQGFPALKGALNWNGRKLVHDLEGEMRNLPFTAKGNLEFPETGRKPPLLQTVVRIPNARSDLLNDWMPRDWTVEQGTMSHRISIRGPVNRPRLFHLEGVVEGKDWVIGFQRDPNLKIPLTSIKGGWNLGNEILTIPTLELRPPHGAIESKIDYRLAERNYRMTYAGKGLRVEDFYQQNVDGDFITKGKLAGSLPKKGSPLNAVTGTIAFKASSGKFYQLEPLRALLTALNPLSVTQLNEKGLRYDSLGGDFKIAKGKATTKNLALLSPEMKIYMAGWADVAANRIGMQGRFQPSQTLDKAVKAVPILGEILTGGKKGGIIETRFKLSGPLNRPKVTLDAEGTLAGKGGDILRELGRLPGKFSR